MTQRRSDDGTAVRRRESADLAGCVAALSAVHRADGYPVDWPADPARWIRDPDELAAWVALGPPADGAGPADPGDRADPGAPAGAPVVLGHVSLCRGAASSAGAVWAERFGGEADGTGAVARLFVAPEARGGRLGARLLAAAVAQARAWELRPVLDVVTTGTAAVRLYRALGWRLVATVDQHWSAGRTVAVHCFALDDEGGATFATSTR
ncbi:GNAT family N-acetyltransferase [Kitasatospora nipponensis]